jgi:hypothetical protein
MNKWISRILFWLFAILPFLGLLFVLKQYGSVWFTMMLLVYVFAYRPVLHIVRLLNLGLINKNEIWKLFIPFYQTKFIKSLWLG